MHTENGTTIYNEKRQSCLISSPIPPQDNFLITVSVDPESWLPIQFFQKITL